MPPLTKALDYSEEQLIVAQSWGLVLQYPQPNRELDRKSRAARFPNASHPVSLEVRYIKI